MIRVSQDQPAAGLSRRDRAIAIAKSDCPDYTVVQRVLAGHSDEYEIILRRYNQRLFRTARSILNDDESARDALQEAYVRAYYKLDTYQPTGSFAGWLTKILVNEALQIRRKSKSQPLDCASESEEAQMTDPVNNDPADILARREMVRWVESAVDQLPDDFRSVFVLRAVEQLDIEETASCLGIAKATVKTRLHRARKLLRDALDRDVGGAATQIFEFAGARCDRLVADVLARIEPNPTSNDEQIH